MLLLLVVGGAVGLGAWKHAAAETSDLALASQPEHQEVVETAIATTREHVPTTTAIGTVRALRSITLSNELPGTVRDVFLPSGGVVEEGVVLVAFDVSVEEAELRSMQAEADLAETLLGRLQRALDGNGVSAADVDRARSERDVALAQVARQEALIRRKTIRAPFRGRVGLADVHPGQYLESGTLLTTLQGVDEAVHVEFSLPQQRAASLRVGDLLDVRSDVRSESLTARIVAIDARVDARTRNTAVRTRVEDAGALLAPGASVRVRVPLGTPIEEVVLPTSALRRGPAGEFVFVLGADDAGVLRAGRRRVVSGPVLGDEVVIVSGLAAGERTAAAGSFKLHEGARVALADETVAAGAAQ